MKEVKFPLFRIVCLYILISVLNSCSKESEDKDSLNGYASLKLSVENGIHISDSKFKSANLDEFTVTIYTADHQMSQHFETVADVPELIELEVGSYYVEVNSGAPLVAAFDSPYYRGVSDEFSVNSEETKEVSVVCTLSNIAVSVAYSQNVINDFEDFTTTISNADGELVFGKEENRTGYFLTGPLYIECLLSYHDAENNLLTRTLNGTIDEAEIRKHYEVLIDFSLGSPEAILNITLDEAVDSESIVLGDLIASDYTEGDVILTEFMANPDILADGEGEWMEFYNTTLEDIDLQGFTVSRVGSSSTFSIDQSLIIPSHDFIVLAVDPLATDQIDYDYNGFSLTNSSGQIQLISPEGAIVSDLTYTSGMVSAGRSAQLSPGSFNATDYKMAENWTLSSIEYISGNTGTPGSTNEDL